MEFDPAVLLATFVAESEERLSAMEEAVVALDAQPRDPDAAEHLLRIAHTLKGDASILDLPAIIGLAHVLEDVLDRVGKGALAVNPEIVDLLLASVDALRAMVAQAAANELDPELGPDDRALVRRLAEIADAPEQGAAVAAMVRDDASLAADGPQHGAAGVARTLRVDIDKLDRMLNLTGEIAIGRGRLGELLLGRGMGADDALEVHRELDRLFGDLQELIMKARMVAIGPTFHRYARMVRDVARSRGKLADLEVDGGEVEVDSTVVDRLRDPLTHLIRNAIDHGIEPPDARAASGKPARGKIVLRAQHESGGILVEVLDDGAGLDKKAILSRARLRGIVTGGEVLSDAAVHRLVFESGFSTASSVTELSGRGVGMDIVKRDVESVRGSVSIDSREGQGTCVSIRLPLTVALIDGLVVGVETERYIIPIDAVVECAALTGERSRAEPHGVVQLRGQALPFVRLRHAMGLGGTAAGRENVVVVRHGAGSAGVAVDVLYGESQTVIKPLGRPFRRVPGVSGSSILSSGKVALILDVPGLLEAALRDRLPHGSSLRQSSGEG